MQMNVNEEFPEENSARISAKRLPGRIHTFLEGSNEMKQTMIWTGLLVMGLTAGGSMAAPIQTTVSYLEQKAIAYAPDPANGQSEYAIKNYSFVGTGNDGNGVIDRTIIIFELPDLNGQTIQSATFSVTARKNQGTPAGNAVLYHLADTNGLSIVTADFDAAPATSMGALMTPTSPNNAPYSLDVTSAIQTEYVNYSTDGIATFRIEIPDVVNTDTTNLYYFGRWDTEPPSTDATLTIVSVPEPAMLSILILGSLLLLKRRASAA